MMIPKRPAAIFLSSLCLTQGSGLAAAKNQMQLAWSELGPVAVAAAVANAAPEDLEGGTIFIIAAVGAGAVIGSAIGGYYIGKAADRQVIEITVKPQAP